MKTTQTVAILSAMAMMLIFSIVAVNSRPTTTTTYSMAVSSDVQKVMLSMQGGRYILEPSELRLGVPVEMEVQMDTVSGCMQDIVISSFGVRKYVQKGDNIIRFTPDKAGTFGIACSMNMGQGKFKVVE